MQRLHWAVSFVEHQCGQGASSGSEGQRDAQPSGRLSVGHPCWSPPYVWSPLGLGCSLSYSCHSIEEEDGGGRGECSEVLGVGRDPDVESLHQILLGCLRLGCADLGLGTGTPAFLREAEFFSYVSLFFVIAIR